MAKHKLIGIIFPFVLFINIVFPLFGTPKAHADDTIIQDQYKIWRSYRVVMDCMNPNFSFNGNELSTNDSALDKMFDTGKQIATGDMYNDLIGIDENFIDCDTNEDMKPVLKQLGYTDARDFGEAINKNQYKEGNKESGDILRSKVENALQEIVNSKGSRLALDQQPDFQYWFANKLYRSNKYGCDGVLNNEKTRDYSHERAEGFWYVGSDAQVKKYTYANFNKDNEATIEGVDSYMTRTLNDTQPTCINIANWLTEARAKEYAEKVKANPEEAANVQAVRDEATAEATSCETQNTGIMDWVLCGIINAIDNIIVGTDGNGGLLGAISDILYIGPDLYNNPGLKVAWSYFRNIATLTLVLIGLVMVIGQAISKE